MSSDHVTPETESDATPTTTTADAGDGRDEQEERRECPVCGGTFTVDPGSDQQFCSNACINSGVDGWPHDLNALVAHITDRDISPGEMVTRVETHLDGADRIEAATAVALHTTDTFDEVVAVVQADGHTNGGDDVGRDDVWKTAVPLAREMAGITTSFTPAQAWALFEDATRIVEVQQGLRTSRGRSQQILRLLGTTDWLIADQDAIIAAARENLGLDPDDPKGRRDGEADTEASDDLLADYAGVPGE